MSRLSEELRERCKAFASRSIRLYITLPKAGEEVRVVGKQLLRSGTSVLLRIPAKPHGLGPMRSFARSLMCFYKSWMRVSFGWSY